MRPKLERWEGETNEVVSADRELVTDRGATRRRFLQAGASAAFGAAAARLGVLEAPAAAAQSAATGAGEIRLFAGDYAPEGWRACDGDSVANAEHPGLANVLGTTFGASENGRVRLPDFRSRALLGTGEGSTGSGHRLGERGSATAAKPQNPALGGESTLGLTYLIRAGAPGDVMIGEIRAFGFSFAPHDPFEGAWSACNGAVLRVHENTALFSVIGYKFLNGFNAERFALPDLDGRTPLGHGDPPGLPRTPFADSAKDLDADGGGRMARLHVTYCIATKGRYPRRSD